VLRALGVEQGDRVVIYMPMVPEAVDRDAGLRRIGAVHSVVFGGFAPPSWPSASTTPARRSSSRRPAASSRPGRSRTSRCSTRARAAAHTPERCVILQRPQAAASWASGRRLGDARCAGAVEPPRRCRSRRPTRSTSSTPRDDGRPKGIVRDNGGHAVALRWSMANDLRHRPGDVFWAASDVGWVVGHSYIVYAPLLAGATTVLYEGKPVGTPDAGAFWRVIAEHGVNALFTAPTAFRAIKKEDPAARPGRHDVSSLRTLFLAGERLDPDTYAVGATALGVPVVDNWWQTETGWPICANPRARSRADQGRLAVRAGAGLRRPGARRDRRAGRPGREGAICIRCRCRRARCRRCGRTTSATSRRYLSAFPGWYLTGDGGYVDEDGYLYVMGRTDDVINVAGHRLSTGRWRRCWRAPGGRRVRRRRRARRPQGAGAARASSCSRRAWTPTEASCSAELVQAVRDGSGRWRRCGRSTSCRRCPRRAPARSCADDARDRRRRTPPVPGTIEDASVLDALAPVLRGRR
jgi:propionyl-CoA synthetase